MPGLIVKLDTHAEIEVGNSHGRRFQNPSIPLKRSQGQIVTLSIGSGVAVMEQTDGYDVS